MLAVGIGVTGLVIVGLGSHTRRRRSLAEFLGGRAAMTRLSRPDLYRRGLRRTFLLAAAGTAVAVAAAEPRWEGAPEPPSPPLKRAVLAIDISASMQAEDEDPTRLGKAVEAASASLDSLAGYPVGLLLFAGTAYPLAPPTLDHDALRFLLRGLVPRLASAQDPGTLISVAIDESLALMGRWQSATAAEPSAQALRDTTGAVGRSATPGGSESLIVLISDGEVGESDADVTAAVARAAESGVTLYAIGVGSAAGARMVMPRNSFQLGGPVADERGVPATSRLRAPLLRRISANGGGAYAHQGSPADMHAIQVALADMGPAPEPVVDAEAPVWGRYDLPFVLVATALVLIVMESLLGISLPVLRFTSAQEAS